MVPNHHPDVVYNHSSINKPALVFALAIVAIGVLLILSAALMPLGIIFATVGLVWAAVVILVRRPVPPENQRI